MTQFATGPVPRKIDDLGLYPNPPREEIDVRRVQTFSGVCLLGVSLDGRRSSMVCQGFQVHRCKKPLLPCVVLANPSERILDRAPTAG